MNGSRRAFLLSVPVAGGALAIWPDLMAKRQPVLSFHMDQPWIDRTGEGRPYVPPAGARGGAPLADFDAEALSRYYGQV